MKLVPDKFFVSWLPKAVFVAFYAQKANPGNEGFSDLCKLETLRDVEGVKYLH